MKYKSIDLMPVIRSSNSGEQRSPIKVAERNYVRIDIFSEEKQIGCASGTAISPNLVVTCSHVVFGTPRRITSGEQQGMMSVGQILVQDPSGDLIMIRLKSPCCSPWVCFATDVEVGEELHNISNFFGESGVYKKLEVAKVAPGEILAWFYSPIVPSGVSGSAVYNREGECSGIIRSARILSKDKTNTEQQQQYEQYKGLVSIIPPWRLEEFVRDAVVSFTYGSAFR